MPKHSPKSYGATRKVIKRTVQGKYVGKRRIVAVVRKTTKRR